LEYFLLGDVSAGEKKTVLFFVRTAKSAILFETKNLPLVVACIENAVTVKYHKEGYVEQRAYF